MSTTTTPTIMPTTIPPTTSLPAVFPGDTGAASAALKAEAYVNAQSANVDGDIKTVLVDGCALVADLLNGQEEAGVSQEKKRALAGQVLEKMQRITRDITACGNGQIYPCFCC